MNEITLLLPETEAKKWLIFQQFYDPFLLMVDKGVFSIKNGRAILHFDSTGTLGVIERSDILYSSRFK